MRGNVQKRPDIFSTGRVGIHEYGWVLLGVAQAFIFSIAGISSHALAGAIRRLRPELKVTVADSLDDLAAAVAARSLPGDLVLAMGAGDVNGLWGRLQTREDPLATFPLAA